MKVIRNFFFGISGALLGREISRDDRYTLFQGIWKSIAVHAVSYTLVFAGSILFIRVSGIDNYGIYVNIFNWLAVLSIIACAGMEDIVLAEIPALLKNNRKGAIYHLILLANKTILLASLASMIIFGCIIISAATGVFFEYRSLFLISLVNVYFLAFIIVNQQALQAFNRFYASQSTDKILKPLLIATVLVYCWLAGINASASLLVISNTVILFVCAATVGLLLKVPLVSLKREKGEGVPFNKMLAKSGYFLLISLLFLLKSRIGMLIIGSFGDTEAVGILNITYRLADFVLLPYLLIHMVVPQLFSGHLDSEPAYKRKLFRKSTLLLTMGSLFIFLLLLVFGKAILRIYDTRLEQYYNILVILCGCQFLYSLFGPSVSFLMMQGGQRQAALALLADITVNCILLFFLFRRYQLEGAAWAALAGSLFYNVILRILVERRLAGKVK